MSEETIPPSPPQLPLRWVWPLHPLEKRDKMLAWGNQQVPDDGTPPGQPTTLHSGKTPEGEWFIIERFPSRRTEGIKFARQFYIPTEEQLTILRKWRPGANPHCPDWYSIKGELVAQSKDPNTLNGLEAP